VFCFVTSVFPFFTSVFALSSVFVTSFFASSFALSTHLLN
jgi:hypothetical protein